NGGMSFHGGLTGTTIAMIIFARRNAIPIWSLFDIVAAVVPLASSSAASPISSMASSWGRLTDVPWSVVFPTGGPFARHPSQLYEAGLEGIVLLLVLAALVYGMRALKCPGFVTGVFVCGYALSRIFVEFFREPDAQLGYLLGTNWLTMGMVLSSPMILLGLWAMLRARRQAALQL
ncbi:prolipoprotein diacylglyceryl transferase, partial [Rhizobium sp. Pop5]|uniref:prolipoprotein diacylglyceryl transferase n=1 Tax=Rhizobium sp. Pop5 TaxID=1223565 RepID=UPI0002838708